MDFYKVRHRSLKRGVIEVYPDFSVGRSKDLMIRGRSFYAIWNEQTGLWSTDEYDVARIVDEDLREYAEKLESKADGAIQVQYMNSFSSRSWRDYRAFIGLMPDSSTQLDSKLTFSNTEVKKSDYVSKRLPYPLQKMPCNAFMEILTTLYNEEERQKLEWAIGSIVAGDSVEIQKFVVLYGPPGGGKGTILNIIQQIFEGYYTTFEAKSLVGSNNAFATEVFRSNPLVAIQHDGDLSRIEDNTKLNSIVSHEEMVINEKHKPTYTARVNSFLFMGTNKPVKISDAKSGVIRRLIDVKPSGKKIEPNRYQALMMQIGFELGGIAQHCLEVYRDMGKNFYSGYSPTEMMLETDMFYNFVEDNFEVFYNQSYTSLQQAFTMYKTYMDENSSSDYRMPMYRFRDELKNYFGQYHERVQIDGERLRKVYQDFAVDKFKTYVVETEPISLSLDSKTSLVDDILADYPAQYANEAGTPIQKWANVDTSLSDLDTRKVHYVKPPLNHIVIDFDLKDEDGEKSAELNLEAASMWPSTYAEFSKGGAGIHLHYIYDGDVEELSRIYDEGIEVKVFVGNSSLRRRVSRCNDVPIATISSGLPLKEKKVINQQSVKNEKNLRNLIERNLRKEIHGATRPSIDFIHKILDDAYESGMHYDVTNMRHDILAFANNSTNQAPYCVRTVAKMKFHSDEISKPDAYPEDEGKIAFFDLEVFPNLFLLGWAYEDDEDDYVHVLVNPTPQEIETTLFNLRLIGFNNRRYDNHILYARFMGYNNEQLYKLSQKIIEGSKNSSFGEAYNLSYTDIYDYASKKQSLKKWEIELGIHHKELAHPWDEPVPEDKIPEVIEYMKNDVRATKAVHKARQQDFAARKILAELSGLTVNDTTQRHTAKIVFGNDPQPQKKFVYTDLSETFYGYKFEKGQSTYRGEVVGEGGYVHAEPGAYTDVVVLDVASMHPTSIEALNLFGPYTKNFSALKEARLAIKHEDYDRAGKLLGGALRPYLADHSTAKELSYALKIVINIVYGLTSAKFSNPFKDDRNIDNIVAKRGALFMINLKNEVQRQGFQAAHIKTDSIKIPGATPEIIQFVIDYGKEYGYEFEHEETYKKMCLVNQAVFIAQKSDGSWEAVGKQFQVPYVYKTLFSKEKIEFEDLCETFQVTTELHLNMGTEEDPDMKFIGKVGRFCPMLEGKGGGYLMRKSKDGKYHSATGAKGFRWMESEMVKQLGLEDHIDMSYFDKQVDDAVSEIGGYTDTEWFFEDKETE